MPGALSRAVLGAAGFLVLAASARAAPSPSPPSLQARAAILVERDLGTTILARHADDRLAVASTTKLMTAYVVLHRARLDRVLTVRPYAATGAETVAGLRAGERLSVGDLLKAMLLPSGGDAAHTLAVGLAGSSGAFVGWMNQTVGALQLGATHFSTPVGLDTPDNYSSARDLASLTVALMGDPFFARTVARRRARLADGLTVYNRNDLVGTHTFVVGVKTGHTNGAGYCLVGAGRRDGANVVSVVLGDPGVGARDADSLALLRYGLSLYHGVRAVRRDRVYARLAIDGRSGERVSVLAARDLRLVLRRGSRLTVYPTGLPNVVRGPLAAGTRLGEVAVKVDGRPVARVPLIVRSPVAGPPAGAVAARQIVLAGGLIGGAALLVGCSLQLMVKRRGGRGAR
ncbi:MAG: D-alanyl-D-alanine carboxypeptidase [Actinobacteria bacterium]|nr:D-alanyl-D-alanine carboxypeptidase [Actinomycetota bacterium]